MYFFATVVKPLYHGTNVRDRSTCLLASSLLLNVLRHKHYTLTAHKVNVRQTCGYVPAKLLVKRWNSLFGWVRMGWTSGVQIFRTWMLQSCYLLTGAAFRIVNVLNLFGIFVVSKSWITATYGSRTIHKQTFITVASFIMKLVWYRECCLLLLLALWSMKLIWMVFKNSVFTSQ
jgi:hypothetical protein